MARYENVKEHSITGLAHAVETKTKLMLDISIAPATIIISETGIFNDTKPNLIADIGLLTITTIADDSDSESFTGDSVSSPLFEVLSKAVVR